MAYTIRHQRYLKDFGAWTPDHQYEYTTEISDELFKTFVEMQKALGLKVYEDEQRVWTVNQVSHDEKYIDSIYKH